MSEILVIYPVTQIQEPVLWGLFADGELTASGRAPIADCTAIAAEADVWMAAPGMDVPMWMVDMPAKAEGKARAMLPFLMEDNIATGLDDMHFALGATIDGQRQVAAISQARMEDWLIAMEGGGLTLSRLVPDFLCLPRTDTTQVVTLDDRAIVRLADGCGFAAEMDMASLMLAEMDAGVTPGLPLPDAAVLGLLYDGLSQGRGINLLQGRYEPKRAIQVDFSAWRKTAVIGGLAAATYLVLMLSQAWWYDHQADRLDGQVEALLRQTFPDITRVVNPRAQMNARLGPLQASASDRFLQLSSMLVTSVEAIDGVEIHTLRFDQGRGELNAEMAYAGFEDMEAVKAAISRQGGEFEEGSSRNNGERMIGDIKVRMP